MKKLLSFSIVIVNWNSSDVLKKCITSIFSSRKTNCILDKVIIVDNASSDNSLTWLEFIDLPLKIIRNKKNYGFAKANNIGAEKLKSDFILFLNPDTVILNNTFVDMFRTISYNNFENIGIYGIQLQNEIGEIQNTCAKFPTLWNLFIKSIGLNKINNRIFKASTMDYWDHKKSCIVDEVIGAFFLVRTDLFVKVKGFDERFFVYYEELDFCKQISDLGFKTKFISEAQAIHYGCSSSNQVKAQRLLYNSQSKILYTFKHFGMLKGVFIMLITFLLEPFARLFFLILNNRFNEIFDLLLGYKMLFENFFKILFKGVKKK